MKCRFSGPSLGNRKKGVDPRHNREKSFHEGHVILAILVLVFVMSYTSPVSGTVLNEHILGRPTGDGQIIVPTHEFIRDDKVASEVSLSATKEGDLIGWVFTGPRGSRYADTRNLTSGQNIAYFEIDLDPLPSDEAVGSWTMELFLNGISQERQTFTVEPLTGLAWWGPFAGLGVLVVVVVIVGGLIVGGLVVLIRVLRRNEEK